MTAAAGEDLLARLRSHDAYTVADAARNVGCGGEIEGLVPQSAATVFVGYALTARVQIEQNAAIPAGRFGGWQLHDAAAPGDVAVLDAGGLPYTATGALAVANLKRRGAVASVVNARVRDVEEIAAMDFPVFARRAGIRSVVGHGHVTDVGKPVQIEGVAIRTGDVLLGCLGGIVVIPRDRCEEVLERAERLRAADLAILEGMRRGQTLESLWSSHRGGQAPDPVDTDALKTTASRAPERRDGSIA